MAKTSAVRQQELASAFRGAQERADDELSGFSRAFKIRDRMFSEQASNVRALRAKKKARKR